MSLFFLTFFLHKLIISAEQLNSIIQFCTIFLLVSIKLSSLTTTYIIITFCFFCILHLQIHLLTVDKSHQFHYTQIYSYFWQYIWKFRNMILQYLVNVTNQRLKLNNFCFTKIIIPIWSLSSQKLLFTILRFSWRNRWVNCKKYPM